MGKLGRGKLETWKNGKLGPQKFQKLEKWNVRPRKIGKSQNWKNGKILTHKNWKVGKIGPGKLESWKVGLLPKKVYLLYVFSCKDRKMWAHGGHIYIYISLSLCTRPKQLRELFSHQHIRTDLPTKNPLGMQRMPCTVLRDEICLACTICVYP